MCHRVFLPLLRSGVIVGWDPECRASEEWMQQMSVDRLPGGVYFRGRLQVLVSCATAVHCLNRQGCAHRGWQLLTTSPAYNITVACNAGGRAQPFYHVLPDPEDRPGQTATYVAQVRHRTGLLWMWRVLSSWVVAGARVCCCEKASVAPTSGCPCFLAAPSVRAGEYSA